MKTVLAAALLAAALGLSACASQPEVPPTVADAQLSQRTISPGESFGLSFTLEMADPEAVERLYVRGLPENAMAAGTRTELRLPAASKLAYAADIEVQKPAADGQYNLELVIETPDRAYVAPLGTLAIRDTPSRILHAQFVPGSHAAADCASATKLLDLEYTVADDNGAADFAAPALVAEGQDSENLVFFPHWEALAWLGGKPGILLNRPTSDVSEQELVKSRIRIRCDATSAKLYQAAVTGQDVSRLTGRSTQVGAAPVGYYVE